MNNTTQGDLPTKSASSLRQIMQQHPLLFYFLIAYVGSWLAEIPYVLSQEGSRLLPLQLNLPLRLLTYSISFVGPTLGAFLMTGICEGKAGIVRLLRRYVMWRAGLQWYLFTIVGIPLIFVLGAVVLPGVASSFQVGALALLKAYPLIYIVMLAFGGPLGEEPGWRGFALPRLQRLYGPLKGALLLGFIWGLWHFLLFFTPNEGWFPGKTLSATLLDFGLFVLFTMSLTVIMTWISNNTKNSLLFVILLHASVNTFGRLLDHLFLNSLASSGMGIGSLVIALLVIILTRGRLSYQPEITQPEIRETMKNAS